MREKYLRIDPNSTLASEISKLQRLSREGVTNEPELASFVDKVRRYWAETKKPDEGLN